MAEEDQLAFGVEIPGEPDIVMELIGVFETHGPQKIELIKTASESRDLDAVRKSAHHFKSTCHNVGARRLAELCGKTGKFATESPSRGGEPKCQKFGSGFWTRNFRPRAKSSGGFQVGKPRGARPE